MLVGCPASPVAAAMVASAVAAAQRSAIALARKPRLRGMTEDAAECPKRPADWRGRKRPSGPAPGPRTSAGVLRTTLPGRGSAAYGHFHQQSNGDAR